MMAADRSLLCARGVMPFSLLALLNAGIQVIGRWRDLLYALLCFSKHIGHPRHIGHPI